MLDRVRGFLYLLGMAAFIGLLWTAAWAKSIESQAARPYWPAKDPALVERALHGPYPGDTDTPAAPASETPAAPPQKDQ